MILTYECTLIQDDVDCIDYLATKWDNLTGYCMGVDYSKSSPLFKFYLGDIETPEKPKKAKYVSAKIGEYVQMSEKGIFVIPDIFKKGKFTGVEK